MLTASSDLAEAIVFVGGSEVSRVMLQSEFEAILDSVVPMTEFANQTAQGVYVRINSSLHIVASVFFLISFDAGGSADRSWNIPLQQLADSAGRGPDLGSGAIQLACQSQCSIAWQQKNLWDPDMTPACNTFGLLRKAISDNRLGLVFEQEESVRSNESAPTSSLELEQKVSARYKQQFEQQFRDRMAQLLKEQRLRISTLNNQNKDSSRQQQLDHQRRLEEARQVMATQKSEIEQLTQRNQSLKETIDGQAAKINGLREYFESKLQSLENDEASNLQAQQEHFKIELDVKVEAATAELKELLEMRDFELMYRNEQETVLRDELDQLRQENQDLIGNSGDELLQKLSAAGLDFVAYHPGVGHLTISVDEMSAYLESPQDFAAARAGVTPAHYQQWLEHSSKPCCNALRSDGQPCGVRIEKTLEPGLFHVGESDRCGEHQTSSSQLFAIIN